MLILDLEFIAVVKRRWLIVVNILGLLEKTSYIENVILLSRFSGGFWVSVFGAGFSPSVIRTVDITV